MIPFKACANIFRSGISKLLTQKPSAYPALPSPQKFGGLGPAVSSSATHQCQLHTGSIASSLSSSRSGTAAFNSTLQKSGSSIPALTVGGSSTLLSGSTAGPLLTSVRTILRIYFPRPRENKRIKNHGWKTRMSCPSQRRIIMRRILKGRHVLTH